MKRHVWWGLVLAYGCGSEPPLCDESPVVNAAAPDAAATTPPANSPVAPRFRGFDLTVNFIVGDVAISHPDSDETCFARCGRSDAEQRYSFRVLLPADKILRASDQQGEERRMLSATELSDYETLLDDPALTGGIATAANEDPLHTVTCPAIADARWSSQLLLVDEQRFLRPVPQAYGCFQSGLESDNATTVAVSRLVHWAIEKAVEAAGCTAEDAAKLVLEQDEEAEPTDVRALCRVLP